MTSEVLLSVVVPCFNEEENIPLVLKGFASVLKEKEGMELIVVDNGSKDQTGRIVSEEIAKRGYTFARKVTVPLNQGYGFGILSGLREAKGKILAWTHADLQTDPRDVLRALELYLESSKTTSKILVKGYRKHRKLSEGIISLGMQWLTCFILGTWLVEINAQPTLFPRALYEQMKAPPRDFTFDLYLLYLSKRLRYQTLRIPVEFKDRFYGEAKGGGGGNLKARWNLIRSTVRYLFQVKSEVEKNFS